MINWENLRILSKMESAEDIKTFEEKINELADNKDPTVLSEMMGLFDDNCQHPEIMYALVHALENFPDDIYVKSLLFEIENGIMKYPSWLVILIYGILNNPNCYRIFKENMGLAKKESLLRLFEIIEQESPQHEKQLNELKDALQ
ncbi:MAG: hypothetical protein FJX71_06635 [Alphaproteobacteria bacterium]|nr:hypothetical protein [Alphaproteobacteria bacterium]